MIALWNWTRKLFQNLIKRLFQRGWPVISFPTSGFDIIEDSKLLGEEKTTSSPLDEYYPVNIGDVLDSRYQVVGKLGSGRFSTVWLARDLRNRRYVSLKVLTNHEITKEESEIYKEVSRPSEHPGRNHVRDVLDKFTLPRSTGDHICLVHPPLGMSIDSMQLIAMSAKNHLPMDVVKMVTRDILLALDYLHTERKLVHTDIKGENILQVLEGNEIFDNFVELELKDPSSRKIVGDKVLYEERMLGQLKRCQWVLGDLGSTVKGDEERNHLAQPQVFRSPEVMLEVNWSYPTDIWNLGVVVWQLVECELLFSGWDMELDQHFRRIHLGQIIGLLGMPPNDLLQQGKGTPELFDKDGNWIVEDVEIKEEKLEDREDRFYEGEEKEQFLSFIRSMVTWRQEDRLTAAELLEHPWLKESEPDTPNVDLVGRWGG
ncbi:unnamed protein product [Penicillium salamii]|uniref:non-specific serine/threonine protein kinase n=1 Tax=Penicillium salamii TaxID=1612424 RepID=A0A9W4I6I7_9EURO|nr:unnamed protein product [Penicillium salamii]CAG8221167.1 unnamed protein product [Penicillium salamii]CAG8230936.1 unnamed protein product [Penicillium salamii]CAG8330012.1 unnamed protein product [Penicillium salamii]CAG8361567.1 unnamed protein product [Penicillium salamii]